MRTTRRYALTALALLAAACAPSAVSPTDGATLDATSEAALDAAAPPDAPAETSADATADTAPEGSLAGPCASAFGASMPAGYLRTDGYLVAAVGPEDSQCAMPNSDHLVLQLRVQGAVYRLVVNVLSTVAGVDPDVRYGELSHALPGPAWQEGFHVGLSLDYARDLGVRAEQAPFAPLAMPALVAQVRSRLALGAPVSVFAQGSGGSSAHLVHRYGSNHDGAVVLDPQGSAPRMLLFHFANQSF